MNDNLQEYTWLKELFLQDQLYAIKAETEKGNEEESKENSVQTISYTGQYRNGVIVVHIEASESTFESTEEYILLQKILKAVNCDIQEVALCNLTEQADSLSAQDIIANLEPQKALFFLNPQQQQQLDLSLPRYQPETGLNNMATILSDPLSEIKDNPELKRKLWMALQQVFPK